MHVIWEVGYLTQDDIFFFFFFFLSFCDFFY